MHKKQQIYSPGAHEENSGHKTGSENIATVSHPETVLQLDKITVKWLRFSGLFLQSLESYYLLMTHLHTNSCNLSFFNEPRYVLCFQDDFERAAKFKVGDNNGVWRTRLPDLRLFSVSNCCVVLFSPQVQLFSDAGFQGSVLTLEDSVPSLQDSFSVASCKVVAGRWAGNDSFMCSLPLTGHTRWVSYYPCSGSC